MEIPLSSEYMSHCGEKKAKEFTHVRYTPITTPPRDFGRDFHYLLRPTVLNRDTELFIVVTLYNEDEKELAKTLHSVFLNIAYLCKKSTPRSWGPNGWQNVIVIVVADGRSKINPNSLALLSILGVFPGALDLPHFIDAARITAHLFEVTSQVSFDGSLKLKTAKEGLVPVQLMFLLKEQNLKKIDSHRWFFSALGPKLNPNICLLIDAGTVCQRHSLYHLWRGMRAVVFRSLNG